MDAVSDVQRTVWKLADDERFTHQRQYGRCQEFTVARIEVHNDRLTGVVTAVYARQCRDEADAEGNMPYSECVRGLVVTAFPELAALLRGAGYGLSGDAAAEVGLARIVLADAGLELPS